MKIGDTVITTKQFDGFSIIIPAGSIGTIASEPDNGVDRVHVRFLSEYKTITDLFPKQSIKRHEKGNK